MSCISVSARRASNPINATAGKIGLGLNVDVRSVSSSMSSNISNANESISVSVQPYSNTIELESEDVEEHLNVRFGLICMVNKERILQVKPEHIFLMLSNNYTDDVDIFSNVEWQVLK